MNANKDDASQKVRQAAKQIVQYLEHDEFHSYLEALADGDNSKEHIWHSVCVLRDWLGLPVNERREADDIREAKSEAAGVRILREHLEV
jgi:hypothetical protein